MKSGFIRGIWGIYDKGNKLGIMYSRRTKIDNDILLTKLNPYSPICKVYVFGEDNYKKIIDDGWDATLIDKKPICWDMEKEQYRHKIEIWKYGLQDFDKAIFLDWDCVPVAPIPNDFWDVLDKGAKIKATIYQYKKKKAYTRLNDERKLSASTFVYMNGKEIANNIIKTWEEIGRPWSEEIVLSQYIDNLTGGWKGIEYYKNTYEPLYHTLYPFYGPDYVKNVMIPHNIFYHLNYRAISNILGDAKRDGVKNRLDNWYIKEKKDLRDFYNKINI